MTDYQQAAIDAAANSLRQIEPNLYENPFNPERYYSFLAQDAIAAAEPHLRKKWAEEWGIGDETSRPLYDARLRIGELEGEVHYKDREIRRLDFELNIALGFLKGDGE